jgi:hypothetical protein
MPFGACAGGWVVSAGGIALEDEAGNGPVGGGQGLAPVGPAGQLLSAFVVGEGVFDADALR